MSPCCMSALDLIKATIVCAGVSFLVYSYPVLSQALLIGVVGLIWLSYFYRTVIRRRAW